MSKPNRHDMALAEKHLIAIYRDQWVEANPGVVRAAAEAVAERRRLDMKAASDEEMMRYGMDGFIADAIKKAP